MSETHRATAREIAHKYLVAGDALGLKETSFEDYMDSEQPPVRRFRASYCRR